MNHLESFMLDSKKNRLRYRYWETSSKAYNSVAVILHAEGMHSALYGELVSPLLSESYKVYAFDFPGFGDSSGDRGNGKILDYTDILESVRRFVALAEGAREIVLIGHGMGALVGIAYLKRYPETPMRLVAMSPLLFGCQAALDPAAFSAETRIAEALSKDPRFTPKLSEELVQDIANTGNVLLENTGFLKDRKIIFLTGESDPVVPFEKLKAVSDAFPLKSNGFKSFPRMMHDCLADKRSDQVIQSMVAWLSETRFEYKIK